MKFIEGKCQDLRWGRINPDTNTHQRLTDRKAAGKQLCREGPQGTGRQQADHEPVMCPCGKGSQQNPGLCQKGGQKQVKGGDPSPLFSTGEATSGVLCPSLGSSVQERHGATGASPAQGHKDV